MSLNFQRNCKILNIYSRKYNIFFQGTNFDVGKTETIVGNTEFNVVHKYLKLLSRLNFKTKQKTQILLHGLFKIFDNFLIKGQTGSRGPTGLPGVKGIKVSIIDKSHHLYFQNELILFKNR